MDKEGYSEYGYRGTHELQQAKDEIKRLEKIIKEFERVSCHQISYSIVDRRPGDAAACYADATYAKEMMGWSAKLTLAKMCEDQWRWQKNMHRNL